jgi:hypothetical protein
MNAYLLSDDGLVKRLSFSNPKSDTANAIIKDGILYIWGHGKGGLDFHKSEDQNINIINKDTQLSTKI